MYIGIDGALQQANNFLGLPYQSPTQGINDQFARAAWQNAQTSAKNANRDRLDDILKIRTNLMDRGMGYLKDAEGNLAKDLKKNYMKRSAMVTNRARKAGVLNTSIPDQRLLDVQVDEEDAMKRLKQGLVQQKLDTDFRLTDNIAATKERVTDEYPDVNLMAKLEQGIGAGSTGGLQGGQGGGQQYQGPMYGNPMGGGYQQRGQQGVQQPVSNQQFFNPSAQVAGGQAVLPRGGRQAIAPNSAVNGAIAAGRGVTAGVNTRVLTPTPQANEVRRARDVDIAASHNLARSIGLVPYGFTPDRAVMYRNPTTGASGTFLDLAAAQGRDMTGWITGMPLPPDTAQQAQARAAQAEQARQEQVRNAAISRVQENERIKAQAEHAAQIRKAQAEEAAKKKAEAKRKTEADARRMPLPLLINNNPRITRPAPYAPRTILNTPASAFGVETYNMNPVTMPRRRRPAVAPSVR